VQQTVAGHQPVDVRIDGERACASMVQEPARFGPVLEPAGVLAAVGLGSSAGETDAPPQVVGTGVAQIIAPLADPSALARLRPDWDALAGLLGAHDAITLYLAAPVPGVGRFRARAFTASALIGEDPATGSAVGPLCALVAGRGGPARIEVDQGVEMGRPGRLLASLEDGRVRVTGGVAPVLDGTLRL
jgi:trans-2,3-dihydro-3-hydroxyanthranilate isomerase